MTVAGLTFAPTVVFTPVSFNPALRPGMVLPIQKFSYSQNGSVALSFYFKYDAQAPVAQAWEVDSGRLVGQSSLLGTGNNGYDVDAMFSIDGQTAYFTEMYRIVAVDLQTGLSEEIASFSDERILSTALTPEGKELLVGVGYSSDGFSREKIVSLDLDTGQLVTLFETQVPPFLAVSEDSILLGGGWQAEIYSRETLSLTGFFRDRSLDSPTFRGSQGIWPIDLAASATGNRGILIAHQVVSLDPAGEEIPQYDSDFESRRSAILVSGMVSFFEVLPGPRPCDRQDTTCLTQLENNADFEGVQIDDTGDIHFVRLMTIVSEWSDLEQLDDPYESIDDELLGSAALSPTGKFAFVGRGQSLTVYALDGLTAIDEIPLDSKLLGNSRIAEIVVNPLGRSLAVVVGEGNRRWVTVIDLPENLWDEPEPKKEEPVQAVILPEEPTGSLWWVVGGLISAGAIVVGAVLLMRRRARNSISTG
jgi:hypothetical protein